MTTITNQHPSNRSLFIQGNYVLGIGDVTIRESLGGWNKFTDWICCNTRVWQAFNTNLGLRHIDVQDDDLRNRLSLAYNPPPIPLQRRPISSYTYVNFSLNGYDDTRLHQVCRKYKESIAKGDHEAATDSLNAIRKVIAYGGDPFLQTVDGISSFDIADNDLDLIKVLTRTEHLAFKDIHDFWDAIYPPCIDKLPVGHEEWIRLLPESFLHQRLEKLLSKEERESFPSIQELSKELKDEQERKGKTLTAQEIVDYLRSRYSAFETICKEFGSDFPKILEGLPSVIINYKVFESGDGGTYLFESHTIHVERTDNLGGKFTILFFEMMHALQRERFVKLDQLMRSVDTRLPREVLTFFMEYIEFDSIKAYEILVPNIFRSGELRDKWIAVNKPTSEGLISHASVFRRLWDKHHAWKYVARHREDFEARLKAITT